MTNQRQSARRSKGPRQASAHIDGTAPTTLPRQQRWCNSVRKTKCLFVDGRCEDASRRGCRFVHFEELVGPTQAEGGHRKGVVPSYMERHALVLRRGYLLDLAVAVSAGVTTLAEVCAMLGELGWLWDRSERTALDFITTAVVTTVQSLHYDLAGASPLLFATLRNVESLVAPVATLWVAGYKTGAVAGRLSPEACREFAREHVRVYAGVRCRDPVTDGLAVAFDRGGYLASLVEVGACEAPGVWPTPAALDTSVASTSAEDGDGAPDADTEDEDGDDDDDEEDDEEGGVFMSGLHVARAQTPPLCSAGWPHTMLRQVDEHDSWSDSDAFPMRASTNTTLQAPPSLLSPCTVMTDAASEAGVVEVVSQPALSPHKEIVGLTRSSSSSGFDTDATDMYPDACLCW